MLNKNFTIPNIPSRLLGYWSAKLPVIAATDPSTDLYDSFIKRYNGGVWVEMGDIPSFINKLNFLYSNQESLIAMGERGYQAILDNYEVRHIVNKLDKKLQSIGEII